MESQALLIFLFILVLCLFSPCNAKAINISKEEYMKQRLELIDKERTFKIGGSVVLNADEQKVNKTLMIWKMKEMELGQQLNGTFPPAIHFFKAKRFIDDSLVFQFIRKMPKGAALHVHDGSMGDIHWVVKNATYDKNCYMCFDKWNQLLFRFFGKPPSDKDCNWSSVPWMRSQSGDPVKFDEQLFRNLTMVVDDPDSVYPDSDAAWKRFQSLFLSVNGIIFYTPFARDFTFEVLREFYEDNVQYVEMRGMLPPVYDLDGTVHDKDFLLRLYQNISKQFVNDHPDFLGLRFIQTSSRTSSNMSMIASDIQEVLKFRQRYPDFVLGYDIVGQEDRGHSLLSYIDQLLAPSQAGKNLPYFFHAGETDFEGTSVDLNLFDAILLNTTRIGHGFAITKHPVVMEMIKKKNIAIEVCPISNQVLRLVKDLRNHPAAVLMANGYPVVISSDDPGFWNSTGLSYDFYEAFMGLGGTWADLATLKQLASNSIQYSGLPPKEKQFALNLWQKKWDSFIHQVVEEMSLENVLVE